MKSQVFFDLMRTASILAAKFADRFTLVLIQLTQPFGGVFDQRLGIIQTLSTVRRPLFGGGRIGSFFESALGKNQADRPFIETAELDCGLFERFACLVISMHHPNLLIGEGMPVYPDVLFAAVPVHRGSSRSRFIYHRSSEKVNRAAARRDFIRVRHPAAPDVFGHSAQLIAVFDPGIDENKRRTAKTRPAAVTTTRKPICRSAFLNGGLFRRRLFFIFEKRIGERRRGGGIKFFDDFRAIREGRTAGLKTFEIFLRPGGDQFGNRGRQ